VQSWKWNHLYGLGVFTKTGQLAPEGVAAILQDQISSRFAKRRRQRLDECRLQFGTLALQPRDGENSFDSIAGAFVFRSLWRAGEFQRQILFAKIANRVVRRRQFFRAEAKQSRGRRSEVETI